MDCQMTKWKQGLSLVDVVGRDTSFVDRDIFLRGSSRASNSIDVRIVEDESLKTAPGIQRI